MLSTGMYVEPSASVGSSPGTGPYAGMLGTDATGTVSETIGVNASDNATPTIQASFTRETADLIRSAVAGSPAAARCDAGVQQHSADTIVLRGCHP